MLGEVGDVVDARMRRQVARRGDDDPRHLADAMRDQRRIGQVRDAKREVHAFVDQVDRAFEQVHAHVHGRVLLHEGVDDRTQHLHAGEHGRGDRQRAARHRAFAGGLAVGLFQFGEHLARTRGVTLARFAQLDRRVVRCSSGTPTCLPGKRRPGSPPRRDDRSCGWRRRGCLRQVPR